VFLILRLCCASNQGSEKKAESFGSKVNTVMGWMLHAVTWGCRVAVLKRGSEWGSTRGGSTSGKGTEGRLSVDRTQDYRMTVPKRCILPSDMCLSPESVTMRIVCQPALMAESCGLRQPTPAPTWRRWVRPRRRGLTPGQDDGPVA
jgi:hypothetical protein